MVFGKYQFCRGELKWDQALTLIKLIALSNALSAKKKMKMFPAGLKAMKSPMYVSIVVTKIR
jgi:hypothetical protein